jgi:hypothetical protein
MVVAAPLVNREAHVPHTPQIRQSPTTPCRYHDPDLICPECATGLPVHVMEGVIVGAAVCVECGQGGDLDRIVDPYTSELYDVDAEIDIHPECLQAREWAI